MRALKISGKYKKVQSSKSESGTLCSTVAPNSVGSFHSYSMKQDIHRHGKMAMSLTHSFGEVVMCFIKNQLQYHLAISN